MLNQSIQKELNAISEEISALAREIWANPETGFLEYHAAQLCADFLRRKGFRVNAYNCKNASLPANTVVAEFGSGKPVIGFVGEYDALDGLGQEVKPERAPLPGAGHGCGHSLMTPAAIGAALSLKAAMEAEKLPGTLRVFACPAEEITEGKQRMQKHGDFEGTDCIMAWHPGGCDLKVREGIQNFISDVNFEFFGKSAHAAASPELGRSALDAAELMNVGVNYLREHIGEDARIHYNYMAAGDKPNIVPAYAALHYFVRSASFFSNNELMERVEKCAAGAAMMTETTYKMTINARSCGCTQIEGFNRFFNESLKKIPPLEYDAGERRFAEKLYESVHGFAAENGVNVLPDQVLPITGVHERTRGSTDAGYMTRAVPTSRLQGLGVVRDVPMHSWGAVACVGHSIGIKAALFAAAAQAQCGYDILLQPEVVKEWRAELDEKICDGEPTTPTI